jgi:hypothetical protein
MPAALPLALIMALAKQVAPDIAPDTFATFVCAETGNQTATSPCTAGDMFAIHDNTDGASYHPDSAEQATAIAARLVLRQGHSADLGLAQINFTGPVRMGLSIGEAFIPRRNIAVAGVILADAWKSCQPQYQTDEKRLKCAAALYNAGRESGAGRRYAAGIWRVAATLVPSITKLVGPSSEHASSDFPIAAPDTTSPVGARPNTSLATPERAPVFIGPAKVGRTLIYRRDSE